MSGRFTSTEDFEEGDFRRANPRFQGDNFVRNLRLVNRVVRVAHAKGATPAQVALAWVLSRGEDVVPIPGTKHVSYLEQNVRAADLELTADDLATLEQAFPAGVAAGDRYAPAGMLNVGV